MLDSECDSVKKENRQLTSVINGIETAYEKKQKQIENKNGSNVLAFSDSDTEMYDFCQELRRITMDLKISN